MQENPIMRLWTSRAALAPMAGVTDRVFRRICRACGSGAGYTPMISAKSVWYDNRGAFDLMRADEGERPLALQLFGHEPDDIARAIDKIDLAPFAWIDLNMGCPAPKITRQGEGSALMKTPNVAESLIRAAVRKSPLPVSVKFRKGWDEHTGDAVEFAKMAEGAGASMICVHPRYAVQMYAGSADAALWETIVKSVSIPVVASGDIRDAESAARALSMGCAGVMIGRASFGDPWVFQRINDALAGKPTPGVSPCERLAAALAHARMLTEDLPEHVAMLQMRKHVAWYIHGAPGAGKMRAQVNEVVRMEELEALLSDYAKETLDTAPEALREMTRKAYEMYRNAAFA